MVAGGPAGAVAGSDRQWPELVECEAPAEEPGGHFLDAVQFGLEVRVGGLLPGAGPLEGDIVAGQDLSEPFPLDRHLPGRRLFRVVTAVAALQVGGQFPDAEMGERQSEFLGARDGRGHDERDVVVTDAAGRPAHPVRVQRGQPPLVERVNHTADGVLIGGDQPGDGRYRRPGRRREDHQPAADPDGFLAASPDQPQQVRALGLTQATGSDRYRHHAPLLTPTRSRMSLVRPRNSHPARRVANPVKVSGHRTSPGRSGKGWGLAGKAGVPARACCLFWT